MNKFEEIPKEMKSVYAGVIKNDNGFDVAFVDREDDLEIISVECKDQDFEKEVFLFFKKIASEKNYKIAAIGIEGVFSEKLTSDLWLEQDIVSFVVNYTNKITKNSSIEIAEKVRDEFDNDSIIQARLDSDRRVRTIKLVQLEDYKKTCKEEDFKKLLYLAENFKKNNIKMTFFSSTPRGGGVALMRHALIRLIRLLGVNINWHVMVPDPDVFEITKKKFHNIIQAVAPKAAVLTDEDKEKILEWTEENVAIFRDVFKESDVIVIDDPQPSGMIPFIKKINPKAKVIYRSHIQMETDLMDKRGTQQNDVWDYLWGNISSSDVFISHPVENFIPKNVPQKKTVLMPATTDRLDGLNKELPDDLMRHYLNLFNSILKFNDQKPLDLERPYIIQVARFDPSKGIPDVIESYRKLRIKMKESGIEMGKIPQLVITGHGSVDDPEGTPIYEDVMSILSLDIFDEIRDDIKVARLPHSDQMLNAVLRGSMISLQLSHKEGFEVKVSEALDKGKPVIAYRTGGIPLQIKDGQSGFLIESGNTSEVADKLYGLLTSPMEYEKMSKNARKMVRDDYFTVANLSKWLFLANKLLSADEFEGNRRKVRDMINESIKDDEIMEFLEEKIPTKM